MTPAALVEDSTDALGNRRVVFDLGDGERRTLTFAPPVPGMPIPAESIAIPLAPGSPVVPGFMLWMPFEGEPQWGWLGYESYQDVGDRWMGDLVERNPRLAEAIGRLLIALNGFDDDDLAD